MHRTRRLAFHLALSHGVVALLGCAFLAVLLALALPGIYVRERQEALVRSAEDLADEMAVWLAGEEAPPNITIAALEARGVRVVDAEQRLVAWSTARRVKRKGRPAKVAPRRATAPLARTAADRIWQERWPQLLAGRIVRGTLSLADGDEAMVVAAPARHKGHTVGAVIINARLADLREAEGAMLPMIAAAAVAAAAMAMLAGVALSRRMARPLQRMTQAAERVAAGDLDIKVEPPSWQEGESLAIAFNRMTTALAAQERARRQFIADASHQLRAPLTSLQAQTEALLDGIVADAAAQRSFMVRIAEDTKSLAALAQQLLDLERLEATDAVPRRDALDVGPLLRSVVDAFPPSESARIVVNTATDLPLALASTDEARQALVNLLDNALKHTPAAKLVHVWARAEGNHVRVGVTDEGDGIAPEHLPRVWDRFYRVPGESSTGTGLGLAIARRLAERQGGSVSAESAPGAGSTFSFTLPRAPST
jgi:signal transduction histidine kinase